MEGRTPYSIPAAAPFYGPLPYLYRDCPQLVVVFRTAPGTVRRLVPEPLVPNPDDLMFLMIGRMNSDEFGTNREAFIAVPSSLGALTGNYAALLYLDNDAAIASGREIWGWPKKAAELTTGEEAGVVFASARRGGGEIIRAGLEIAGPVDPADLRLDPTWFNLKLIPSIVEGAAPDVMQITATTLQNVRVENVRGGRASVGFANSAGDPLADLIEVREVLAGFHMRLDCDLTLGEVVHDYLANDEPGTGAVARTVRSRA